MPKNVNRKRTIPGSGVETRIARQASEQALFAAGQTPATLATVEWKEILVESFEATGSEVRTDVPEVISTDRQPIKGEVVGSSVTAGFRAFLRATENRDLIAGFLWDTVENKTAKITGISSNVVTYEGTRLSSLTDGSLILVKGTSNNNKIYRVTDHDTSASTLTLASGSTDETSLTAATMTVVGYQFPANSGVVAKTGLPTITGTSLLSLGLKSGQAIYIGDTSNENFSYTNAGNNGIKRVRSVTDTTITIDKSVQTMVGETNVTSKTIRIFWGPVIKNSKTRQFYQIERKFGIPVTGSDGEQQAQYLTGLSPGAMGFNIDTQALGRIDFGFQGISEEIEKTNAKIKSDAVTKDKRISDSGQGVMNTSVDVKEVNFAPVSQTDEAPETYFGVPTSLSFTVDNGLEEYTGLQKISPYSIDPSTPTISGSIVSAFVDVPVLNARVGNEDSTANIFIAKNNEGMAIDWPLTSVAGAPPEVTNQRAISINLDFTAGVGRSVHSEFEHAIMFTFFDYLPDVALATT